MVGWAVLLSGIALIAGGIWSYKRHARQRDAASAARMKAMLDAMKANVPAKPPLLRDEMPLLPSTLRAGAMPAAGEPAAVSPSPRAPAAEYAGGGLLDAQQFEWYTALCTALPDHRVVPRPSLAAFVRVGETVGGLEREARERRLAMATVDFLVCDKALRPLAAVCLAEAGSFVKSACDQAGVRVVVPAQRDNLRGQVLNT